ncbi:unnamed protein product [Moneuplotes crassus]|uniref:VTT domain-containing protein n=1 Tax=Euplotes crassus TaxID=5936 RepID=A0AAD1UI72_EUPCR|nr:unnamed protein product [Moneuplotes crassus]
MNSPHNNDENVKSHRSGEEDNKDENDSNKEEEEQENKGCNWCSWIFRIAIILLLIGLAVWVIVDSSRLTGVFEDFIDWMEDNPILAPFVFIVVYILATIFFLPGLILTLGAGFAFNEAYGNVGLAILVGSIAVWCGAMLGSMLAMLIGRYLLRDWVGKKAKKNKYFGAIDTAIEKEGFKLTLLLRLSPAIPFNLFNYLMGITKVAFSKYTLGGLGMIPGTIVYVYFGTTISNISDAASGNFDGGILQLLLLIIGSILAIIAVFYVSWVARKEVRKVIKRQEEEKNKAKVSNGQIEMNSQDKKSNNSDDQEVNLDVEPVDNIPDEPVRAESMI